MKTRSRSVRFFGSLTKAVEWRRNGDCMELKKLGDSYDAVKRLWYEIFKKWGARLHADSRFFPRDDLDDLQARYTRLTTIPVLHGTPAGPYSILNDPDTGIRLPDAADQKEGLTHIRLDTISEQLRPAKVRAVVTFDQSHYRQREETFERQREAKMRYLTTKGLFAFYYASHAPFLFTCRTASTLQGLRRLLLTFGIPKEKLEPRE